MYDFRSSTQRGKSARATLSDRLSGTESRRPRPLEVEATEMTGNVDDFSNEK